MTKDAVRQTLEALRKDQILDAAARVFAEKGFRAARMQEVADGAGVANGTIYNYFSSKDELLMALLGRLNETEERPAQFERMREATDPRRALFELMQHRYEVMSENRELMRALLPEIISTRKVRGSYLRKVVAPNLALADEAVDKLGVRNAAHLSRAMAASVFGLVLLDLMGEAKSREEAPQIVAVLSDAFTSLLWPDDGASTP